MHFVAAAGGGGGGEVYYVTTYLNMQCQCKMWMCFTKKNTSNVPVVKY